MHPRLRRTIAGAGVVSLAVSALCFLSEAALRAAPLIAVRLHLPLGARQVAIEVPSPAPSPEASPLSLRRRSILGEGPIVLKGTGTYQLGLNRSSRNGLSTGYDNYSSALTLGIERRTEQSAVSVTSALGYAGGAFNTGSLLIGYRTPKYGLAYGQVTGPGDSQLQIGGFARGVALTIPLRNGDISYLTSTALQQVANSNTTYRVYGVRRNWNAFGGFLSAAGYYGAAEQGSGRQGIADLSLRHYGASVSTSTEVALSTSRGGGNPRSSQVATAFQADVQGKTLLTTLGIRYDPAGFQTLTGSIDAGLIADLALRKHSERFGDFNIDLGHTDDRSPMSSDAFHDNRITLSGGKSWKNFGVQYVTGFEDSHGTTTSSLQRSGAITFSETLRGISLFETYQAAGAGGSNGGAMQRQFAFGATRALFGGSVAYQFARSVSGGGDSVGDGTSNVLSYRRSIGKKLDMQLGESFQTSNNNGASTRLIETTVGLTRRLSNVVAIQATADFFRQTGVGGGRGMIFAAGLTGPFGFGQPTTGAGRANPNLPAVIRGNVTYSLSTSQFANTSNVQRGLNNALLILDGKITQRTDSAGEFEFRFVPQGTHTIRIDAATLAPGLIADREYQTVSVYGGTTTTIEFNVGNFAGVAGTVLSQDQSGAKKPLPGIGVAVDGVQAVVTTPDGHYQIGRLTPGAHTVELVDATIPSTVAVTGDKKKTITVTPGSAVPVNFVATPLGSIGGNVVAPNDGGFGALTGLHNVYVVAEPGEHAGITDDDGSFLLDNLPPGTYTVTVDPDTVPEGLSVLSGPDGPVTLSGASSVTGLLFKLGAGAKQVVYTFDDGKRQAIHVETEPAVVPPGAALRIRATTNAKELKGLFVESDIFGNLPLHLDPRMNVWSATVVVPSLVKGDYAFTVTARRKDVSDASTIVPVDPNLPLFAIRMSRPNPQPGQSIRITIKALANLEEGDALLFEDGYKVVLPKPNGRVFAVDVRIWRHGLPYSGTLVTKRGQTYSIALR